jgi:segregation and condensation protein B
MELSQIIPHIEALIFASDKPLTSLDIVELINNAFGFMDERVSLDQVEAAVSGIREKYSAEFYPFEVRESGGGWQFLTKKDYHKTVGQLNGDKFLKRLSNAALETLAIIAYKQPITKGEVEAIRGVNSDYSIQKLLEKELIVITGRNENLPGKPLVYSTSKAFMDYFGINDTGDLPKIKEVLADQLIEATVVSSALNAHEDEAYQEARTDEAPKAQIELFADGSEAPLTEEEATPVSENETQCSIEGETPLVLIAEVELETSATDRKQEDEENVNSSSNDSSQA